ncbi:MAG: PEP-CTERM sorting domain-containing protein [Verrucomicrobiae bacterium]|nr:PEP-CTERM sorting domain-containing protein [Verrucomicrobiae bacterium]
MTSPPIPLKNTSNHFFAHQYKGKDINLYYASQGSANNFSTNAAAFTGIASFSLLPNLYYFQPQGTIGDVYVGDGTVQSGPKIGSYMVVTPLITANGDTPSPSPARGPWNAGSLTVGNTADGSLTIAGGGSVYSTQTTVGNNAGVTGAVTVTGAGSDWSISSDLFVGQNGAGNLTVSAGGRVSDVNGHVGANVGSTGTVLITGTNSTWSNTGDLHIGQNGTGSLTVSNGGAVSVAGALTVHGAGDSLTLANGGTLSADGGVFILADAALGGAGTIAGDLTLASGARLQFDPQLSLEVNGAVALDPSFGVASILGLNSNTAAGSYTLLYGTSTDFSALGIQNWGLNNAYALGVNKWAYFSQGSLVLNVVPEPGTYALLALGLGAALFARARRARR